MQYEIDEDLNENELKSIFKAIGNSLMNIFSKSESEGEG